MRIVIISDTFPFKASQQEIDWNLANFYSKNGHEVHVISSDSTLNDDEHARWKNHRLSVSFEKKLNPLSEIINLTGAIKLAFLLQKIKPDVIHIQKTNRYLSYFSIVVSSFFCSAVFFTAHDVMSFGNPNITKHSQETTGRHGFSLRRIFTKFIPLKHSFLVRLCLNRATKVFAVSKNLGQILKQNGVQNVVVIYNGVNESFWSTKRQSHSETLHSFNIPDNKRIVLFVGVLDPLKSVGYLLEAMELVSKEIPNTLLVLAGEDKNGGYTEAISEMASHMSLDVRMTGRVDAHTLANLYQSSEVTVTFSILNPYSMVALESMTCGTPVIWGCRSGVDEVINDYKSTNFVSDVTNPSLIAKSLISVLGDQKEMNRLISIAKEISSQFTLDKQAKKFLKFYKNAQKLESPH